MSKIMEKATETSGFLDGREYTAAFLYEFFSLIVGNGVYANELAPTATNENMTITHGVGHAWINGVCYKNTTPFVLDIATADGILNRYDSLMLRLNLSINEVYAIIVQGDYATTPTPPAVTRNADIFDLKICDIYIPAGCTKITQAQITDTRLDSSVCGVPVFPVEHLDMTTFYQQVATDLDNLKQKEQAEILALLEQLNYLVESDTVGKLVAEINKKLALDGTAAMTGDLPMGGHRVMDVGDPEEDGDAVNLGYANENFRRSDWMPTAPDVGARPNTWFPTITDIGAAPAGYGLGTEPVTKNWSEVDSLYANGWYRFLNLNTTINGVGVISALVRVDGYSSTYKTQTLYAVNTASGSSEIPVLKRTGGYGGSWQPWECVNPPMVPGVEYRTTERFEGKAVYCKMVSCGALVTAGNSKNIGIGVTPTRILRHFGFVRNDNAGTVVSLPIYSATKGASIGYHIVNEGNIYMVCSDDGSAYTSSFVALWYTKD